MREQRAYILLSWLGVAIAGQTGCSEGGDDPPGASRGAIAAACAADTDCEPGLVCIGPDANEPAFGGGPAAATARSAAR